MSNKKNVLISEEIERQRKYYAARASSFEREHIGGRANRCHRAKIIRIHRWLNIQPGQRVLEVGTGTGVHAGWLMELCAVDYIGVDLSPDMMAIARDRLGDSVELCVSPAEELPFAQASFDGVFCSGTLHHIADKGKAIREMAHTLKRGRRLVLSEPNPWNPNNMRAWMTSPMEKGQRDIRINKIHGWFDRAGLRIIHTEHFNFTPPIPQVLESLFEVVDRVCSRVPGLRKISSMLLVVGERL